MGDGESHGGAAGREGQTEEAASAARLGVEGRPGGADGGGADKGAESAGCEESTVILPKGTILGIAELYEGDILTTDEGGQVEPLEVLVVDWVSRRRVPSTR